MTFIDRKDAGRALARLAQASLHNDGLGHDALVLALPRGGVPVAFEIARELSLPLDLMLVRKLGVPGHEELAMGAIASGGVRVMNDDVVISLSIPDSAIAEVVTREAAELVRREQSYRAGKPPLELAGRAVILVDDGVATGADMLAAIAASRRLGARRVIVAVPVAPRSTHLALVEAADQVICAELSDRFTGVGVFYRDFSQTTDKEVRDLVERAGADFGSDQGASA